MNNNGFHRFDTLEQFLAVADTKRASVRSEGNRAWRGNEDYDQSRQRCFTGNTSNVSRAESILEKIEASGLIKRGTLGYVPDVAGEFPNVPAYLAGDVECMMRKGETETATDRSPLRVYVDLCVGADWSADALINRGVHILALVQLLSERRVVELYWFASMGLSGAAGKTYGAPAIPVVPLETQPLDLSTASHVLASAGFFRNVCFAFNYAQGGGRDIPWAFGSSSAWEQVRTGLGAEPDDLVVHGGANYDTLKSDPMAWLISQLTKYAPDMLA